MNRMLALRSVTALLLGAAFVLLPLPPAHAETKKSSAKKATTSKRATPSPTPAKKKTATTGQAPAKTTPKTAAEKNAATAGADAPLPVKVPSSSEPPTSAAKKSTEESAPPAADAAPKKERAPSATVEPETIIEFAAQPAKIQQLIRAAIDLTRQNLSYAFGSADPAKGGMDCSGTIYYLLRSHGLTDVARDSSGQYLWAREHGMFFPVVSKSAESPEFAQLLPGDLMFWTGTYSTGRDVPISHVMMYLGREKETKKRIMFGASDGRSYNGVQRWGVSVFDFKMPRTDATDPEKAKADFVGYARMPGLREEGAGETSAEAGEVVPPASEREKPRAGTTVKKTPGKKATLPAKSKTGAAARKKTN